MKVIKTVGSSDLRDNLSKILKSVEGEGVVQVLHRTDSVKMIIAQDYFLKLVSVAMQYAPEEFERPTIVKEQSPDAIMKEVVNGIEGVRVLDE